ncbi:MAG: nucleotide exchange factor GrpE [Mycobacteriales bacterium]
MTAPDTEFDPERVVVRDKRRLDPQTGEVRDVPAEAKVPAADVVDEPVTDDRVAELTADLQRVSAEYANYRKRVDRDRGLVVEMATSGLLAELLPLLDDVERARQHGDLDGAFKSVGEGIEAVASKLGLERFGAVGDAFDPAVHEALMAAEPDPQATVSTCAQVLQPGYRLTSGRVLRPARVAVSEPGAAASTTAAATDADVVDVVDVEPPMAQG